MTERTLKNMPKLSRRNFLKRAPVAAVAAPSVARDVAKHEIMRGPLTMSKFGLAGSGNAISQAESAQNAHNKVRDWIDKQLREGIVPDHLKAQFKSQARYSSFLYDDDIESFRSVPGTIKRRLQEDRNMEKVIEDHLNRSRTEEAYEVLYKKFSEELLS